jgi:hypothetical protein
MKNFRFSSTIVYINNKKYVCKRDVLLFLFLEEKCNGYHFVYGFLIRLELK